MSEQNPWTPPTPPPAPGYGQPPGFGAPVPPPAAGYGQPQPGYGVPQQPGLPQQPGMPPQSGQPWPGAYYPVAPVKKSRRGLWITLGCVGGAIVIAGGVLVATVANTVSKLGTHTVVLPQTFQGLNSDPTNQLAQQMQSGLNGEVAAGVMDSTVATVYHSDSSDRGLVVYGGAGRIASPRTEEGSFWDNFESSAKSAHSTTFGPRQHPSPGPQGGVLSCEDATTGTETDAVCLWVDNSSLVVVMQTTASGTAPDLGKAAQDTRDFRAVAEVPK